MSLSSFAENAACGDQAMTDPAKRLFADIRELRPASRCAQPILGAGAECTIWVESHSRTFALNECPFALSPQFRY